jgi:Spy/CpxP family protein refolding chaperone
MRTNKLFLTAVFGVVLAVSGVAQAHDGNGSWSAGKQCENQDGGLQIPPAKMKILHDAMKASFEKDKGLNEKAHKLHDEMKEILAAETFNQKAFLNVSTKLADIHARLHQDRMRAFASVAGQFTPEEREEIMKAMHRHHHMGKDAAWHHQDDVGAGARVQWNSERDDGQWQRPDQPMNGQQMIQQPPDNQYPPYSPR